MDDTGKAHNRIIFCLLSALLPHFICIGNPLAASVVTGKQACPRHSQRKEGQLTSSKVQRVSELPHEVLVGQLRVGVSKHFKGACCQRVFAFVWMNKQGNFAVLPFDLVLSAIKSKAHLLKRVELESSQDPVDLVVTIHFTYLLEE